MPDATGPRSTHETAWGVRLTLNRPAKLNALSAELVEPWSPRSTRPTADPRVRVVVIEGAGRAFSAGYDLTEEAEGGVGGPVEWRELLAADVEATLRILDCPSRSSPRSTATRWPVASSSRWPATWSSRPRAPSWASPRSATGPRP